MSSKSPKDVKVKNSIPPTILSSYSHAPVLVLMSLLLPIKRVLELGAGGVSTTIFVNRNIYSTIEQFDTYDNGPEPYIKTCRNIVGTNPKYQLKYSKEKMADMVAKIDDINSYDLILIDDSAKVELRAETITRVTQRIKQGPVILIHDFEQHAYQAAIRGEFNWFIFSSVLPHTGVFWKGSILNTPKLDIDILEDYKKLIGQHFSSSFPQNDYLKWKELFKNHMKS